MKECIISIDAGTTGITVIAFDKETNILNKEYSEFKQIYPKEGWVEHDPIEILIITKQLLDNTINKLGKHNIKAIGITNQRETTVVWDKNTGNPIYNAIVWQCRRTAELCEKLKQTNINFKQKTGLIIDAYFSATKLKWILNNIQNNPDDLLFGTIDTWLLWNLSKEKTHATDVSNASRTMMFNINTLDWDNEILEKLKIPKSILPEVRSSSEVYGHYKHNNANIPIAGIAGDQQAALFGQCCFQEGEIKNTYGTGCFILMNTGEKKVETNNLLTTIAWKINNKIEYALEGSVFIAGAAVQWLRDGLKIINNASETEQLALSVNNTANVYFVPALSGLGAPYWDMYARGTIVGITRGTTKEHIVRATLEAIAYQNKDVIDLMQKESNIKLRDIKVDGGATVNNFLMQFQSDILNTRIDIPKINETTCLGAAFLAGLAIGFWKDKQEIKDKWQLKKSFNSNMPEKERQELYSKWKRAVDRSRGWIKE